MRDDIVAICLFFFFLSILDAYKCFNDQENDLS